jgi:Ran GTPase-activating protein (RanGAP) involved in mRNA processing and transport
VYFLDYAIKLEHDVHNTVDKMPVVSQEDALAAIKADNAADTLKDLNLWRKDIGDAGVEKLMGAGLANMKALTKLNLSSNKVGPDGAKKLAAALPTTTALKSFSFNNNNLGDLRANNI